MCKLWYDCDKIIPSLLELYLQPGMLQGADWTVNFTSLFIGMTLLVWVHSSPQVFVACPSTHSWNTIIFVPADHFKLSRFLVVVPLLVLVVVVKQILL